MRVFKEFRMRPGYIFQLDLRDERLNRIGNKLELMAKLIPWESFRPRLEWMYKNLQIADGGSLLENGKPLHCKKVPVFRTTYSYALEPIKTFEVPYFLGTLAGVPVRATITVEVSQIGGPVSISWKNAEGHNNWDYKTSGGILLKLSASINTGKLNSQYFMSTMRCLPMPTSNHPLKRPFLLKLKKDALNLFFRRAT